MNLKHAFSIDLEDWYQGIELPVEKWTNREHRLEKGLNNILELLNNTNTKATFFCLGWIAKHHANVIKTISNEGHEIASHGYSHDKVYALSPATFREDVRKTKALLEDLSGKKVIGNRSPYFSITRKSLWAIKILYEEGYTYDCSISPVETWRYGISSSPDSIYKFKEFDLIEFPVSTTTFLYKKISIGGAYFRIFPYYIFKKFFTLADKSKMFYCHPWEYDPQHPSISFDWKAHLTHYFNLKEMEVETVIDEYKKNNNILEISITDL